MHFNYCLTVKISNTSTVKVLNIHKCSHIKRRTARGCPSSVIGLSSRENVPILRNQSSLVQPFVNFMMLKVIQVLVVFTLFIAESLGTSPPGVVGPPAPVDSSNSDSKCIKDLLLIIDASASIEEKNFVNNVQPFLMDFVKYPYLNVHESGTRIAMILFSTRKKTKIILNFNEEYDADKIAQMIGDLKWDDISGLATRTGWALQMADEKIFKKKNPDNVRPQVQDVVMLITDGKPTNRGRAKKYAKVLKDKDILIVGVAIGPKRDQFFPLLKKLATTEDHAVKADFKDLGNVIDIIIAKSCTRPATCKCPNAGAASVRLQPGKSEVKFAWPDPTLICQEGAPSVAVKSSTYKSPHMFPVGNHKITYDYEMTNGAKLKCVVSVTIKDPLCGGQTFDSKTQVCCCGEIHPKQTGNTCCGKFYYDTSLEECCDDYGNRVVIGRESCSG